MERPQATAEFEIVFWVLYALAFAVCGGFFIWSLLRYVVPNRLRLKTSSPPELVVTTPALIGEIVALQAQFVVAPHVAITEAKKLLEDRHGALKREDTSAELSAQFEALTNALAQTKSSRELREV